jgi:hypothetical protein
LLAWWYEPATRKPEDVEAASRANDFNFLCACVQTMKAGASTWAAEQ